jgi:hypothetical protein
MKGLLFTLLMFFCTSASAYISVKDIGELCSSNYDRCESMMFGFFEGTNITLLEIKSANKNLSISWCESAVRDTYGERVTDVANTLKWYIDNLEGEDLAIVSNMPFGMFYTNFYLSKKYPNDGSCKG